MEMDQVRYFLSVVESGSFSAASQGLHISQSSLSKQIMALERELGVVLFNRDKRTISLTEAGHMFKKHAVELHEAFQSLSSDLESYRKKAPSLRIVAVPVVGQYGIPSLVEQFRSTHADISLFLDERESLAILPALDSLQYDLAFVRGNYLDPVKYASLEIITDRLTVVVSHRHRFASRTSLCLAELAKESFILYKEGSVVQKLILEACRNAGFEPKASYTTLRGASIVGLVASNNGIALMMEKVLNYYKRPDVVSIPLEEAIESKIVLAYPRSIKPSKPARTFLEFMELMRTTA